MSTSLCPATQRTRMSQYLRWPWCIASVHRPPRAFSVPCCTSGTDVRLICNTTTSRSRLRFVACCHMAVRGSCLRICTVQGVDQKQLIEDVANALYASKICSYAQGMNIIKHKSADKSWDIDLGALARIWKARTGSPSCRNDLRVTV